MKTPRLKPFKAWVNVHPRLGHGDGGLCATRRACELDSYSEDEYPVRVIVRDARDDSEARLKRENARLRRALRFYANEDAYAVNGMGNGFVVGTVVADRGGIARVALERRDRR